MASKPESFWKRHLGIIIVFSAALVFTVVNGLVHWRIDARADVRVSFFDVGQGDSALIRDRDGKDLLIDGGPDDSVLEGLADAMPWWDRDIDVMLVSHLDADHFVGFFGVLQRYHVKEVWWTGVAPNTETARGFAAEVERLGLVQHFAKAGDVIPFAGGGNFRVLWPREDARGRIAVPTDTAAGAKDSNYYSIIGRFDCGTERALFTADAPARVEAELLDAPTELRSEVLKVAHHGSAYSSSEPFLEAVHPREAVISVGAGNRYGHPTPRVLSALLERGIRIRRTDREGTISYACVDGRLVP